MRTDDDILLYLDAYCMDVTSFFLCFEGCLGDNIDVLVGVRDMRCGGDKCGQHITYLTAGAVSGRRSHCDGYDILRRSYLWRTHEPSSYSRIRNVPALPVGSGLTHLSLSLSLPRSLMYE